MLSVQTNLLAQNANRNLKVNTGKNAKITEKLSSGYKINRAADDASGLSMSEKMRRQVRGLHQSEDNINEGVGYVQTAEGALNEVQDILQRINQLSVKAANGTNTPENRAYIDQEIQQLKREMSRIFSETTFNERKIWEPEEYREVVGNTSKIAVRISGSGYVPGGVTEANCEVLPQGSLRINKEDKGIKVGWTGRNGTDYSTELITWEEMANKNYRFDIGDYFDKYNAALFPNGNKLFSYTINMSVEEGTTLQQIKDAVGRIQNIGTEYKINLPGDNGIGQGNTRLGPGVLVFSGYLNYDVAYNLHLKGIYNFDGNNDNVIEPNKIANSGQSNLISYPDSASPDKQWIFSFEMEGIGTVTATSNTVSYHSSDKNSVWWYFDSSGNKAWERVHYPSPSTGTLTNALNTLTRSNPSLLKDSTTGGTITLKFTLKDAGGRDIGSFEIGVGVSERDSESSVSERITNALKKDTVVDLYTTATSDSVTLYDISLSSGTVQNPVYGQTILQGKKNFWVQAGTEAGQHISIEYECLSLEKLGMEDSNVLTQESAGNAIDEVKAALQIVSKQRSDFGAYQNRLEHAVNINQNVEENTQAAESLIRDTDIAEKMMEYSVNNILLQAGTSMLTQANQSKQLVLELLN